MKFKKAAVGLFLLIALGIRLYAAVHDHTSELKGDADGYDQIGFSLASGNGFRFTGGEKLQTTWCTPLYPLFLAGIYRTVGHNYRGVRITQAFVSTLTVLLIALWAGLLFGSGSACVAAFIAAIYPAFYAYYFSLASIGTETLYVFLFTAALWTLYVYFLARPSWVWAVISGLFWGLANLTRPMSLPFLLILPFAFILLRYPLRQVLRYSAIVLFTTGLVIAPWVLRNYLVFRTLVLTNNAGPNLYLAYHPRNLDGLGMAPFRENYLAEDGRLRAQGWSEAERANYFFKGGVEFIRGYPRHALWLSGKRFLLYLDPRTTLYPKEAKKEKKQIVTWVYLFVLAGAAAAFMVSYKEKKHRREVFSLCLVFGYFIFFHAFMGASERYRFPTEPILILLTSFALGRLPFFRRQNCQATI